MDFAVIGHLIWMNILLLTGLMGVSLLYYFFRRNGAIL
ncbi:MAG: hypothetical protein JWO53_31, partial [Chlamydiia bacterium]|nr:hypothetical protein [Chlamydiia bacterium]